MWISATNVEVKTKMQVTVTFDRQVANAELLRIERDMGLAAGTLIGPSAHSSSKPVSQL